MIASYILSWFELFFRWFHVIAGIAWIGASFYFVWLDNSLEEPPADKKARGIKGDLWSIHGGGIYEVAKYRLAPPAMPKHLHWFKWEAYTTWLTGMMMMVLVYYIGAQAYLIDPLKFTFSTPQAIGISVAGLVIGFAVYEGLLRTRLKNNGLAFGLVLFLLVVAYTWLMTQLFSGRGAYIQVGALIGTIMTGNVLLGIMPSQRELVRAIEAGEEPDPTPAQLAKLRSTHNNYFTLPLIFIMLSNHYPMTYGHEYNWLVLAAIGGLSAFARHFFNLRHQGQFKIWILVAATIGLLLLAAWMAPRPVAVDASAPVASETRIGEIATLRCGTCHSPAPSDELFSDPPAGLVFLQASDLLRHRDRALNSIQIGYMPLANRSGMTDEEKQQMVHWLQQVGSR